MSDIILQDMTQYLVSGGTHPLDPTGLSFTLRFPNGYGASIIRFYGSYGADEGLFELGVLIWNGDTSELTYETPITNDVLGWLTPEEVRSTLYQIFALPSIYPLDRT